MRGARVLGLEVGVECIDPEKDFWPTGAMIEIRAQCVIRDLGGRPPEHVPPPARAFAVCREAEHPLPGTCQQPIGFAYVRQLREARGPGRQSGQPRNESLTERDPLALMVMVQEFDLHAGHVDAGGAFA